MSRTLLTTICCFAIVMVVVIAGFFLMDIERIVLNFWAVGSLLFSLMVSLLATILLVMPKRNQNGVFYFAGLSGALCIYELAIVISIFFTGAFAERTGDFILLQIAIHALFFIIAAIVLRVSAHIQYNSANTYGKLQSGEYSKPKRGGF